MATKDQFSEASAGQTPPALSEAVQDDIKTFSLPPRSTQFDVTATVRQYPVTALVITAVAGAILGRLLK